MPKKTRRIISISVLIIIIFAILYIFNIFNINNAIHGISVNKVKVGKTTITTTIGKSLDLPKEFSDHNILVPNNDKIISIVVSETKNETYTLLSTIITLATR